MKDNFIIIQRCSEETYKNKQTDGLLTVCSKAQTPLFACVTTELPWRNNKRQVSHIMAGTYVAEKHNSPKFGLCIHILNVPGRSEILIHPANYVEQLQGCIAPGLKKADVDRDGDQDDNSQSRDAMKYILDLLPDRFPVLILDRQTDKPLING